MNLWNWLFGSPEENAEAEAIDSAVLKIVNSRRPTRGFATPEKRKWLDEELPQMRAWAKSLPHGPERRAYLRWIDYYLRTDEWWWEKDLQFLRSEKLSNSISRPPTTTKRAR